MLPRRLQRLLSLLARLPGVGEKTAQRYVLHLVTEGGRLAEDLSRELGGLREAVRACSDCGNLAEVDESGQSLCGICRDPRREARVLCIVARVVDLLAIERSGAMRGRYFVLGALLSPIDGVGPSELPIARMLEVVARRGVEEVILATPPSVDGEATALLLARELGSRNLKVSRIASGVPHGGDLEFADQITLGRAIHGRRDLDVG